MSFTLLINIKKLLQIRDSNVHYVSGKDMNIIPSIKDAYLLLENSLIKEFGEMKDCPKELEPRSQTYTEFQSAFAWKY